MLSKRLVGNLGSQRSLLLLQMHATTAHVDFHFYMEGTEDPEMMNYGQIVWRPPLSGCNSTYGLCYVVSDM
ncbi:hypothetical protein CR513_44143, partial [Mucuna pruriens]